MTVKRIKDKNRFLYKLESGSRKHKNCCISNIEKHEMKIGENELKNEKRNITLNRFWLK